MKTKSTLLSFLLVLLAYPSLQAQFGIRAGVNLASHAFDPKPEDASIKRIVGIGVGVFYQYNVTDNFSIQPEVGYVQHGAKLESEDALFGEITATTKGGYLQIPVLAKYSFGNMEGLSYYLQAGPYLGVGIGNVTGEVCIGDECEDFEAGFGDEDGPEQLDFGLQLGAGVNITKNISFDARYILGLADADGDDEGSTKNNGIYLTLGYKF